jgi:hypothetical protein
MKKLLVGVILACAPSAALADQCMALDADTAAAAAKLLKDASVVAYCEPCRDKAPAPAKDKPAIAIVDDPLMKGAKSVRVAGKDVDLAYTYVKTGKTTYTNVGLMVGCPAKNVTPFLTIGAKPMELPD